MKWFKTASRELCPFYSKEETLNKRHIFVNIILANDINVEIKEENVKER